MKELINDFINISKAKGYKKHKIYYEINVLAYLAALKQQYPAMELAFNDVEAYQASLQEAMKIVAQAADQELLTALAAYDYLYHKPFVQSFFEELVQNQAKITTDLLDELSLANASRKEVYELAYRLLEVPASNAKVLDCCVNNDMFLRQIPKENHLAGYAPTAKDTILVTIQLRLQQINSDIKELDIVKDEHHGNYDRIFGDMHNFAFDKKACPFNEEIFMQSTTVWENIHQLYQQLDSQGKMVFFMPQIALDHLKGHHIRKALLKVQGLEKVILLPRYASVNQRFDCALVVLSHGNQEVSFIDARNMDKVIDSLQASEVINIASEKVETLNVFKDHTSLDLYK
ncbi:MAG: N-6 DNA methylase [Erysipelotrichaceae bacterium]|nr:N-6 DNA methylase [Erysipelotrichaceae bacterium]